MGIPYLSESKKNKHKKSILGFLKEIFPDSNFSMKDILFDEEKQGNNSYVFNVANCYCAKIVQNKDVYKNELVILQALNDSNFVPKIYFNDSEYKEGYIIIMEWINGRTLRNIPAASLNCPPNLLDAYCNIRTKMLEHNIFDPDCYKKEHYIWDELNQRLIRIDFGHCDMNENYSRECKNESSRIQEFKTKIKNNDQDLNNYFKPDEDYDEILYSYYSRSNDDDYYSA